jgi:hypothetical protein
VGWKLEGRAISLPVRLQRLGGLAGCGLRRLISQGRHHPVLITTPLAALAVGAGFAAQALLRPSPGADQKLLDALIAQPTPPRGAALGDGVEAAAPSSASVAAGSAAAVPAIGAAGAASTGAASTGEASDRPGGPVARAGLAIPAAGRELPLEIRVALLKVSAWPQLSASGAWRLSDRQGRVLQRGGPGQAVDLGGAERDELWLDAGAGVHLLADGRPYDGRFRILHGSEGLRVVNHLPLESYISSVVGGEMPTDWNMEALRAQAIAARSYAMAHMARPADPHWHLGDTTRWQNYTGLSAVNARTRQATGSTAGLILSYRGGIVESLYAATQQIVDEAHSHLGASMSQTGAQELAQQGLRFNEILGRYYRGASLARLQAGAG